MHSPVCGRQPASCTACLAHAADDILDLVTATGMPARTPAR